MSEPAAGVNLGNIGSRLRLQCHRCQWVPPDDMQSGVVEAHFDMDHDTGKVELDLVAVCTCETKMELTQSRPTGGGFKDYFRCTSCGNTGFVIRKPDAGGASVPGDGSAR